MAKSDPLRTDKGRGVASLRYRNHYLRRLAHMLVLAVVVAPPVGAATWGFILSHWGPPGSNHARRCAAEVTNPAIDPPERIRASDRTVQDDACRDCPADTIEHVELRVSTDSLQYIGHAFLHTPNRTVGFRTNEADIGVLDFINPLASSRPGYTRDDSNHEYDYVIFYRVCPRTLALLESAIDRNASAPYQIGDWDGGRNCATWAKHCLNLAGLRTPPGACPNQLAYHMRHAPVEDAGPTCKGGLDK